jgi:microcystin-dependent protein
MTPFLGEIRNFGFNFPPKGWALCQGQFLPINQNQALFALLGTTYGGDGVTTFALPDLRGRVPIGFGQGPGLTNRVQGEKGGSENHQLTSAEMPVHSHALIGQTPGGNQGGPGGNSLAASDQRNSQYTSTTGNAAAMAASSIGNAGGNTAHNNMQPYLGSNWCIALQGIFPSRN